MANRAVISATSNLEDFTKNTDTGIYINWNGGLENVIAFLTYCKMMGFTPPEENASGYANLTTIISNFFGDGLSIEVGPLNTLAYNECYDNGLYIIKNWSIDARLFCEDRTKVCYVREQALEAERLLLSIDKAQPVQFKLMANTVNHLEIDLENGEPSIISYLYDEWPPEKDEEVDVNNVVSDENGEKVELISFGFTPSEEK